MKLLLAGTAIAATLFASAAANAAPDHHHNMGRGGFSGFSGFRDHDRGPPRGDFRGAFRQPGRDSWQHGSWRHERHGDRFGWWFVVDDDWFFYPEPIYPYPAYPGYDGPAQPYAGSVWYRCDDPPGYYPYVARCMGNWQIVPAMPPG